MKALLYSPDGTLVKVMEVNGAPPTLYTLASVEELSLWEEMEHRPCPPVVTFILEWSNDQFALYVEGDNT